MAPSQALAAPVTVMSGPSGVGKTHLARALTDSHRRVWLTMRDEVDATELAAQLVHHLRARVAALRPELTATTAPSAGPASNADPFGRAEQLGALIGSSLADALDRPLTLVIDQIERVPPDGTAARLIEALVRTAPSRLAIVLTTRGDLPFSIQRLGDEVHVTEIGGDELLLDDDGLADLVVERWPELDGPNGHGGPGNGRIGDAVRLAGGRVGLALALGGLLDVAGSDHEHLVRRVESAPDRLTATVRATIARLDDADRALLEDLVVLGHAAATELERLGHGDPARRIDRLVDLGLVAHDPELGDRVTPSRAVGEVLSLDTERARRTATAAVRLATARGDVATGLVATLAHGDDELLAATVDQLGHQCIDDGHGRLVLDAIERLDDPGPHHGLAGRAAQAVGDWQRAVAEFEQAAGRELRAGDAWRHGLLEYLQGNASGAARIYERAMAADHPDDTVADRAMIVGYAGSAAWLSGDLDRARTHSERALELATASRDDAALAVAFTLAALVAASDGDRVSNDGHYIRALRHAERAGDVLQIARIRSNRGSRLMEEGEYDAALAELDDAVAHADIGGYGSMLALALSNRGEVLSKLGRLDDARTDLTASAELLQQLGSRLVAYPLVALARIFLARGDLEQARGSCERALAMSATSGDRQIDVAARVQLARALAAREPAAAWQHAVAAADAANEAGTGSLDAAAAWSTLGLLAIDRDDVDIAARAAATATELARSRRDRYALAGAIEVAALGESDLRRRREQLDEAHNIFDELGCPLDAARVELRLARLGVDASWINRVTAVAALAQRLGARPLLAEARELLAGDGPAAPLAVTTLGTFGVSRGGDAVPGNAWQSKKARDLFKMVVVLRGRSMTRDQAMERLWPGEDPAKVSSKLSVALATVRSVLDPDKAFPADHFLQTVDDAIRIETGHVEIDVERFLSSAEAALRDHRRAPGERSATMLAAVESSYTGDVLEDDPYVDWYVPAREEARAVYLNVTRELAAHHLGSGERDDAIRLLLRILEREPYDEPAHLDLVRALSGVGRHGDARRRYQQYADRMRELDLEPRAFPAQR